MSLLKRKVFNHKCMANVIKNMHDTLCTLKIYEGLMDYYCFLIKVICTFTYSINYDKTIAK